MMRFEDLEAWQQARTMVKNVYTTTRSKGLSHDFGLSDQVQRASVSVMSNIAEGFERTHLSEKLQMYNIARGSLAEVRSLSYVIEDNYPCTITKAKLLRDEAIHVGKLLTGLINSTERRKHPLS